MLRVKEMTDEQLIAELGKNSGLSRVRRVFSSQMGRIEQAEAQRKKPDIMQIRRMEFEAAEKIVEALLR